MINNAITVVLTYDQLTDVLAWAPRGKTVGDAHTVLWHARERLVARMNADTNRATDAELDADAASQGDPDGYQRDAREIERREARIADAACKPWEDGLLDDDRHNTEPDPVTKAAQAALRRVAIAEAADRAARNPEVWHPPMTP